MIDSFWFECSLTNANPGRTRLEVVWVRNASRSFKNELQNSMISSRGTLKFHHFMPESPSSLIVGILPPTMKIENEDVTPTRPAPAPAPRAQRYCQMCLKLVLWFRAGLVLSPPVTGREHPFVQQRPSLPTLCFRPPRVASICIPTPAFTHHGCVSLDFTTS